MTIAGFAADLPRAGIAEAVSVIVVVYPVVNAVAVYVFVCIVGDSVAVQVLRVVVVVKIVVDKYTGTRRSRGVTTDWVTRFNFKLTNVIVHPVERDPECVIFVSDQVVYQGHVNRYRLHVCHRPVVGDGCCLIIETNSAAV